MTNDEKLLKKFKSNFSFLFNDKYLAPLLQDHFDKDGCFISFVIWTLTNQLDENEIFKNLKINSDEWSELFSILYKDNKIIDLYKKLEMNPIVPLENTVKEFDCFDNFNNKLCEFLSSHNINMDIKKDEFKSLLKSVFGFILYNKINYKIAYHFRDVLLDNDYETKFIFILNNTKLFSDAKFHITSSCKDKINDLIVLLLGMTRPLNLNK